MEKFKKLRTSLIAGLLTLSVGLSGAALLSSFRPTAVYAADDKYYDVIDGNEIFYTSIRGAGIEASEAEGEGENAKSYTQFNIGKGQQVTYRQNLAYSWISGEKDSDGAYGNPEKHMFSMEFSFKNTDFKRFIIKFQSQQFTSTEEGVSDNYLIFTPVNDGNHIDITVAQSLDEEKPEILGNIAKGEHATIAFKSYLSGNYFLTLDGKETQASLKNVYEGFATYVSSGDDAVTPLTFSAEFDGADTDATEDEANFVLYKLNGQSFEMFDDNGRFKIKDNAAPVMCFATTPSYLEYGKTIGLNPTVIDVCHTSPRSTAFYYILTGEQYASDTFNYNKVDYTEETKTEGKDTESGDDGSEEEETTEKQTSPFIEASTSVRLTSDPVKTFIPSDENGEVYENVYGLVKIYYELSDESRTSVRAKKDIVFVDWYVSDAEKDSALVDIYNVKGSGEHANFIKLIDKKGGATFARKEDTTRDDYVSSVQAFQSYYQEAIDLAKSKLKYDDENLQDGVLYAGGDKFCLPAIEWDFLDDYSEGRDYKYTIYYKAKNSGSTAALAANKLAIDLNDADVTYNFKIFVTDTMGNPMRYPDGVDETTGEIIWKEITTADIWEEEFDELIPRFTFRTSYREASAEDPKNLSLAYVNSSYSGVSFTIKGVSGMYKSEYKLYIFDRNTMANELNIVLDYNTVNEHITELLNNSFEYEGKTLKNTRRYFTTVKAASQLTGTEDKYEMFKALNWNPTSVSFTPQEVDEYYVVELTLNNEPTQNKTKNYAIVAASVQTTALEGESDWLENNKTSVILLSVSGACLVALIILLVVKPKDKGDIDAIYTEVEKKDKSKKSKKNN